MTARYSQSGSVHGRRQDVATAEWNGQRFEAVSRPGATMKLSRALVEAGCPDQALDQPAGIGRADRSGCDWLHACGRGAAKEA